ncbi:MAG: hypothetical protein IAG10_22450 [Planctomycetaceae bacterium]|nr:hypothetical protein [Planctomycetaceae bacterium]
MSAARSDELSRPQHWRASNWLAVIVGLAFAVPGLWSIAASVPKFDKFASQTWMEVYDYPASYRSGTTRWRVVKLSETQHGIMRDGFDPGQESLFGMVLFALGTGIAASQFLGIDGRRRLALILAVLWHGLGITTAVLYWQLAPRPLTTLTPLLTMGAVEWLGLFPLALGLSKQWHHGRWHEAAWSAWIGAIPGAIVGAVGGFATDLIRLGAVNQNAASGFVAPGWIVGLLIGGAISTIGFFVWNFRRTSTSSLPPADQSS